MREETIKIYTIDELSDEARQHAIEELYSINTDYEWYDYVYEDAKEIGRLMGIEINNIYFSGFSYRGDGACFEGSYSYARGSVKAVKDYAPTDTELHRIAEELQAEQKRCFYQIRANVKHSGHYNHEYCTAICVDFGSYYTNRDYYNEVSEETVIKLLRDFMRWIYHRLRDEYEYQTTEEAILETIRCNEYEFDEDGNLF